jgi:NAD(P)-dependent dehydrogenase (short-subunit alcohol dehydrogenase family)
MTRAYDFDVTGARAVVTGASRGIGAEVARALALAGAAGVTLIARDRAALDAVAEEVRRLGAEAAVIACDVTDGARLEPAVRALGRVDVLVHAAGVNVPQSLADLDLAVTDDLWATNVRAALHLTKLALPLMPAGGVVVLLSSQMGHVGARRRSAYCATKHAVEGVTKALAVELAPRGIRVVAIAPTFVETPMTTPFLADAGFRAEVLSQIPLGRLGTVQDVAAAVRFAASPAAAMITGSSIRVDGGWTAR